MMPLMMLRWAAPKNAGAVRAAMRMGYHSSTPLCMPDVVVPPLGESVSEGSISTLLKNPGDAVQVDDVIAQLETDKVTIDVKSPFGGIVEKLMVKLGDVVQPGAVVAVVGGDAGAAAAAPAAAAPAAAPAAAAPAAPAASHSARKPSISFPPRFTADGRRISDLPAAEQDAALAALGAAPAAHAPAAAAPAAKAAPAAPAPAAPKVSTSWLEQAPARGKLTDFEIDLINLGGAAPYANAPAKAAGGKAAGGKPKK